MIPDRQPLEDDPQLLDQVLEKTPAARYQHQLRLLAVLERRLDLANLMIPAAPCPDCGCDEVRASDYVRTLRLLATATHLASGGLTEEAQTALDAEKP